MKKKVIALSLTVALGCSLLGGCSGNSGETSGQSTDAPSVQNTDPAQPTQTDTPPQAFTYADTIAWDGQYDVVVIGFGGAGATAAATAADEGASVLLVEKAPEGEEGGNTRYCGQLFVYGDEDEEATYEYYKALYGQHEVPDAVLKVYTQKIAHMYDLVSELFNIDKSGFINWTGHPAMGVLSPEYPEFSGSEHISLNTLHDGFSDGYLWQQFRKLVTDRADQIDVWFESPATHLIQDPDTKTIIGVQVDCKGETRNIRAVNGVVMACGGFENNREMVADYLGITSYNPIGSLYNTGDGIGMVMEVGADLWHMEAYEGIACLAGTCVAVPEGERSLTMSTGEFITGASILIAGDGSRMAREDEMSRHGHIRQGDAWVNIRRPLKSYVICDEERYEAALASGTFPDNAVNIQHAGTIAELAGLIGVDSEQLVATVERYNGFAEAGYDPEFGRSAESMSPFAGNSFYAIEVHANMLNTQGGARRNENAEIIDTNGVPIPHLYSAGEFGGVTAFQYQGGGNMAECMIFGQIAGENAAAAKEELPVYKASEPASATPKYTLGVESDIASSAGSDMELGDNEYLGVSTNGMGGNVYVKVTMDGEAIAKLEVVDHKETEGIGDKAIDELSVTIVEANSTEVDNISGATITSRAVKEAVEDALSQAGR